MIAFRKFRGQNAKSVIGNFYYLILMQVVGYVFPLITLPYLARTIGKEGLGNIAFASAVIVWIQTISEWGFNLTATRDIAKNRNDINKVSEIFSNVIWSRIVLMLSGLCILLVLIVTIPLFEKERLLLLFTFLMVPGQIMCPEWLFQGLEKMKYITILNMVTKSVFTCLIFLLIRDADDYILYPLFLSMGFIVSGIIAFYIILHVHHIKLHTVNLPAIKDTIVQSSDLFLNTLAPNLYNSFSIMMLGWFGGPVSNGIYMAGHKVVEICIHLFGVLSRAFFPYLSRNIGKHSIYMRISLYCALFCSAVIFLLAPLLVSLLFGHGFEEAVWVLRIQSANVLFYAMSDVFGKNYLALVHKERILRNITLVSSVAGFVMAFPLVYYFHHIGAAITITLSLASIGLGCYYMANKIQREK